MLKTPKISLNQNNRKYFDNNRISKQYKIFAFSLIELSIVLIIIGLLVAGVTGGASLIQSAKVVALINEMKGYERAVFTFQAAKGRYPGDVMNYGTFGAYSNYYIPSYTGNGYARPGYQYVKGDFSAPYEEVIPSHSRAPFIDLYTEGIIDFEPSTTSDSVGYGVPYSKVLKEPVYLRFEYVGTFNNFQPTATSGFYSKNFANEAPSKHSISYNSTKGLDPKILKAVDEKIDDGLYGNGRLRSSCHGKSQFGYNSYDIAIDSKNKCSFLQYGF